MDTEGAGRVDTEGAGRVDTEPTQAQRTGAGGEVCATQTSSPRYPAKYPADVLGVVEEADKRGLVYQRDGRAPDQSTKGGRLA